MTKFLTIFLLSLPLIAAAQDTAPYLRDTIPQTWQMTPEMTQTPPNDDDWWLTFHDPMLDRLISKAVMNNYNVAMAVKRIEMAKKGIKEARAAYFPTFDLNAGWSKEQNSGRVDPPYGSASRSSSFTLGVDMNWEIDVFGRVAANANVKKAAYNVSRMDYEAVMVSLCSKVATAYMQLRTAQKQLTVNKAHIASQQQVVNITEARFEAELADMLDVTQARTVLLNTQSTLPAIKLKIRTLINTICVLVGEYPGELANELAGESPLPGYRISIDTGVPADLLRRRPDIMQAEMEVGEYAAQAGVAKKDFLPTLSLSGAIGTEAHAAGDLFGKQSFNWSVAPQLSWTIYEGLARNYRLAEARLQVEAAIDNYNLTVMNAVEEVDNALHSYDSILQSIELQEKVVEQSEKALNLAVNLYKTGLTAFSNVVDGQMSWLNSQNQLVELEGEALAGLITIYQALGGGWESRSLKIENK